MNAVAHPARVNKIRATVESLIPIEPHANMRPILNKRAYPRPKKEIPGAPDLMLFSLLGERVMRKAQSEAY